jgi:hypothetical protein
MFLWIALAVSAAAAPASNPEVTPRPRHVEWTGESFPLASPVRVEAGAAEGAAARVLAMEMLRLHGVKLEPGGGARAGITLALDTTPRGRALVDRSPSAALYRSHAGEETYLLEAGAEGIRLVAGTPRGLLHGVQTLLQLVKAARVPGVRIVDYPQLAFRGIHICIFPNTELAAVRQAILVAARFKYNAVVIETWASLASARHPETAYEGAYTPAQLRPLIELGKALGMEMIPMLNSWGHASGMRATSSQHVVLDRFPRFGPLYEEDGWAFCLANPAIYDQLFDRYAELIELFGKPKYFHLGLDEAWGHRGLGESARCRGDNPRATLAAHIRKLYGYFAQRGIRVFVWHDMFIQRDHPQLGRLSPANSVPPFNSHLVLDELPKDIVMDAWNYSETREWPVTKYFRDRGFPVVVSPWKVRKNAVSLVNTAKNLNVMGMLETTWDSLDVTLPTVGESGVLAWTAPGFDLDTVRYEDFLAAIRAFPIDRLPLLERSLAHGE